MPLCRTRVWTVPGIPHLERFRTGETISDLAIQLGFSDQRHFHRRFKRLTGMTPAAYAEGHYRSRQHQPAQRA